MDSHKTREQLLEELARARRRIAEMEGQAPQGGEQERMLAQVLDTIPARVFWKDRDLSYLGCNRQFAADAGLSSPSRIAGMNDFQMPWASEAEAYRADDRKVIETGQPIIGYEEPQTTPTGQTIWLRTSKVPLLDATGRIRGVLGTYEDITAGRRALEALAESEEKYRAIVRAFDGQIYTCSADLRIQFMNKAMVERLGRDATGEPCHKALHGLDDPCPWCANERVFKGETVRWEAQSPGNHRWYYVVQTPVFHGDGSVSKLAMITDITERKKGEEDLRESRERYRIVADNTYDWEFWIGPEGAALYQSPSCERVTGRSAREFMEDPGLLERIVHPDDAAEFSRHNRDVMSRRAPGTMSFRIVLPDGQVRWIEHICQPVFGVGGVYMGVRGSNRDVTESRLIREELKRAMEAAQDASRAKSAFMANMSHEIRTPMNAILGFSRLVLRRGLVGEQREFMEGIMDAGAALMQIIGDILDFSKIEAGRMELESECFGVPELLDKLMRAFAPQAQKKGLRLDFKAAPGVASTVRGDRGRLRQVLVNLVGNAIKFTPEGGVECRVEPEPEAIRPEGAPPGQQRLLFTVRDTGIGIAPDKLEAIFDSFTQADLSTTKRFGGTGLGLAISRRLVSMMHGRIWVESAPGQGAAFFFTAGFEPSLAGRAGEACEHAPAGGELRALPPLDVLLAEDDRLNQTFMEALLKEAGHSVTIAANGREALELLEKQAFDVILMDISMPELDGVQATRAIRAMGPPRGQVPIVAMTAHALKGDRERFLAAGMDGYVAKPVDMEALLGALSRVVDKAGPGEAPPHGPHATEGDGPLLDEDWIARQYSGRGDMGRKLVELYLAELPRRLEEIALAADAGDAKALAMAAHTLKGASGVVGASGVARQALLVEKAGRAGDLPLARALMTELAAVAARTREILPAALD